MNEPTKCLCCDAAELTPPLALCKDCRAVAEDMLRIRRINRTGKTDQPGPMLP